MGDLLGPDGKLAPIRTLPDHVQTATSSVKATPGGEAIEYKLWDKNAALTTMARHLGLFERDNTKQKADIRVQVVLVG